MSNVIIYKAENNGVLVMQPTPEWTGTLEELIAKDVPSNTPSRIVDVTDLPPDGEFFGAWEWADDTINVNITTAKEIWRNKFREARTPIFEKLDVEFMRAIEIGDTQKQQEIAAKKQELRDLPLLPLPDNIEGIKNTWPAILQPVEGV